MTTPVSTLREFLSFDRFFDAKTEEITRLFGDFGSVLDVLAHVAEMVEQLVQGRKPPTSVPGVFFGEAPIFVADSAHIEPGVFIVGPAYIGPNVVLRHGAYVRENVIMLEGSLLGHASEAKGSIFLPGAHAPHLSYIGDSLLGHNVNLGAGTILSNLPITNRRDGSTGKRSNVLLPVNGEQIDTGLPKIGAILGDEVQIGCNCVLSPGTLMGPNTMVYPNASIPKGLYPASSIVKLRSALEIVPKL
jgi:NDP-sugar pyrophosphorylase family protein